MASSSRRRRGHAAEHDNDERWLLTYADMITLLMALFMVLFSISSVNISKYESLQKSLKSAFSGSILSGGKAILQSGSESTSSHSPATADVPSIVPLQPTTPTAGQGLSETQITASLASIAAAQKEQDAFELLKKRLDAYAHAHGFANQVQTSVERRGLVVRVLTDQLLFDSGQATPEAGRHCRCCTRSPTCSMSIAVTPIVVEGYTDNVPISTPQFPSNWELSTARATTVVQYLIAQRVDMNRLGAAGYADLHPLASNATTAGRQLNRRVEIVLQRLNPLPTG